MTLYEYLAKTSRGAGCVECPLLKECDYGAGNTAMDETGVCPTEGVNNENDFKNVSFGDKETVFDETKLQ